MRSCVHKFTALRDNGNRRVVYQANNKCNILLQKDISNMEVIIGRGMTVSEGSSTALLSNWQQAI